MLGKVFISSGEKLPNSLERFSLNISKHKFHDLIAFSKLVVTDSQTTTAEAGELGVPAVLMKGGHLEGNIITDVFMDISGKQNLSSRRQDTVHTHGTGCTLASACATGLAQGLILVEAVLRARDYVQEAIRAAPGYGSGHGPLNHGYLFQK